MHFSTTNLDSFDVKVELFIPEPSLKSNWMTLKKPSLQSSHPVQHHCEVALLGSANFQTFAQSSRAGGPDLQDCGCGSRDLINILPLLLTVLVRHEAAPRHLLSPPHHDPPEGILSGRGKE